MAVRHDGADAYRTGEWTPPRRRRTRRLPIGLLTALLVSAVALGAVWWWNRGQRPAAPQVTLPPASVASRAASPKGGTPTRPLATAPGPGTVDGLRAWLTTDQGFTCTDEGVEGIQSFVCTHFQSAPFMVAYVGGNAQGGLGRVSLEVQEDTLLATSRAVSGHLIGEFGADAATIRRQIDRVESGYTRNQRAGEVHFRGNARGSVVMWVEGWVPDTVVPRVLTVTNTELAALVEGYSCASTGALSECTKDAEGVEYLLIHEASSQGEGLSRLSLRTRSATEGKARPALQTEARRLLTALPGGQGREVLAWMDQHSGKTGSIEFVGGRLVDYYPASRSGSMEAGALYLYDSCWTDSRLEC